jgi:hypothetical protein
MLKVSDQPQVDEDEPEVRLDALHHAREPQSMQATLWLLLWLVEGYGTDPLATYLVDERELYLVPCVNPDGYAYNEQTNPGGGGLWRKNRAPVGGGEIGVDLNRNYAYQWGFDDLGSSPDPASEIYRGPGPASEPEIQALSAFLAQRDFRTALSVHTFGDLWIRPYAYAGILPANESDYQQLDALLTAINGYAAGPGYGVLYPVNGGAFDHEHTQHGTMAWTPEIGGDGDGFWPPTERIVPLAEENLVAFQRTALAAGPFVHVDALTLGDAGDGDGFHEPGETVTFALAVQNAGRDPAAVTATLASPQGTITTGAHDFGVLAPFSTDDTGGSPLALQVPPGAAPGTVFDYVVTVAYDGYAEELAGAFVAGEPRPFLLDPAELDLGWTAGVPGDTATSGLWERGDPIGTSSGGQPASPTDDASPAPGVACWTTGNGGGSSGNDDVDNGHVTLITPRIDLSGVGPALVRYARWHADLNVEDDVFAVSISDDDGATWFPLEAVAGNANEWVAVEHLVPAFVAQTDRVRLRFVASDEPNNSIVEGAVDDLAVAIYDVEPRLNVYGQPAAGAPVVLNVSGDAGAPYAAYFALAQGFFALPGFTGAVLLDPFTALPLVAGQVAPSGLASTILVIPGAPASVGATIHVQGAVLGAVPGFTNVATFTVE